MSSCAYQKKKEYFIKTRIGKTFLVIAIIVSLVLFVFLFCDKNQSEKLQINHLLSYQEEVMSYEQELDDRGSFTELVHTADCGQVSINISRPGITKGQHWHNSKWELFIVVHGHGLIQERNINTGETVEFEVSGEKIEAVHMVPGWTHNIINLSDTEDLVTVMTCNEVFDPERPDTFFEIV